MFNVDLTYVGGMVSVGISVLLWVQVAGSSREDVTTMFMEVLQFTGMSLTFTNCKKQSAALLLALDIHSNVMLYVVSDGDHLFTLLFAFYHSETTVRVCGYCMQQCQIPVDSSSIFTA